MQNEEKYFEAIKEYKLLAKHEVGQNFLADPRTSEAIVKLAELKRGDEVLEIGSGAGSLSYFIAQSPAHSVLLDIDEGLIAKLSFDFKGCDNVKPMMGNVLKHDLSKYTKIIGNLPYYITSAIIERLLLSCNASKCVLMVQKEAYQRLVSPVGSKDYGPLPILLSYRTSVHKCFQVPRTNFVPAPHVDSLVFCMVFDRKTDLQSANRLYSVASSLFLHRRKTILNNLISYLQDEAKAKSVLAATGIPSLSRPEDLSLDDYLSIVHQLY